MPLLADPKPYIRTHPVGAAEAIFKGSFVSADSSGYAAPLAASEQFLGIAKHAVLAADAVADGTVDVDVYRGSFKHVLAFPCAAIAALAATHVGHTVWASSDNGLTLASASNSLVGVIESLDPNGVANTAIISMLPTGIRGQTT